MIRKDKLIIPALLALCAMPGYAQETTTDSIASMGKPEKYADQVVEIGYRSAQRLEESVSSVSTVYNEEFNKRSSKNIGNSLFGYGTGLMTLQGAGTYAGAEPNFFIRGLQTLSATNPLVLVDGIERDISNITPEEVETVTILKDASAVALYGYKGINGVINITTKRGQYNTREVKFTYDHGFDWQVRRPKFAGSYMYANAINEALANDGLSPRYSADELNAFRSGRYPYLYPNVDWIGETFRDVASTNIYNITFRGGSGRFRYYAMGNLTTNKGFIANPYTNDGYSTQDEYSRANLRTNLDIDLTSTTRLKLNMLGILSETRAPGNSASLWGDMVYKLPSAAYPARLEDGTWGGSSTWPGTMNPVAESQAAGYTKQHERTLYADLTLDQDLSLITPGLGASLMLGYDNYALYNENYSKTFVYGSDAVASWENGVPGTLNRFTDGQETALGSSASVSAYTRAFNFAATMYYSKTINEANKIYSQFRWDYENRNTKGIDQSWYRQNVSWYTHYGLKDRYFIDLTLVGSASNKLAPGHKWAFSPTVGAAWVVSKEGFMQNQSWIDFLKVRASFGIINADRLPQDDGDVTDYWEQVYTGGSYYPFDTNYSQGTTAWKLGRLASLNSTHEKAYKYNFGFDASLFKGLDLTFDTYFERRSDIWVSSSGKYSSVLGFTAPYENGGIVDSWGVEISANYSKKVGDFKFNVGANFQLAKNQIIDQLEEPRLYDNLIQTGHPVKQTYGLQAIGFFRDEEDIANSPAQNFGTTLRPGDIKYKDVNGDNIIDSNDEVAIGYSTTAPEIYYSFHLGAEWKGLGFDAMFQGTGRYSAVLNTTSLYWPLINNTTISEHAYENRWTPENPNALYPRLSSESNANNYQTNTLWLEDRSFLKLRSVELYYNFPEKWMKKTHVLSKAKLYVRGVDLLCFDKIKIADPESYGATVPLTRSAIIGLSIGF